MLSHFCLQFVHVATSFTLTEQYVGWRSFEFTLPEDAHATISATFLVEPAHDYRVLVYAVRSSLYPLAERWEKDGVDYELSAETCSAPLRITSRQKPDHEMDSPLLWERQNPAGGVESGAQTPETTRLADSSLTLKERWSNVLIKRAVAFGQVIHSGALVHNA